MGPAPLNQHHPERIRDVAWRQIVNSAIDTAVISTDADGRVTSWSRGAEHILGWTEQGMLGHTRERVFPPDVENQARFAREIQDALSKGRGGGEEGWRVRKDGSHIWAV